MDKVKPATLTDVQEFFSTELKTLMEKHQVSAREASLNYLAGLLSRNLESKNFFAIGPDGKPEESLLTELYGKYHQVDGEEKKQVLQRMGDMCLLMSGFFSERLQRKALDIGYYFGMGGTAYAQLSTLQVSTEPRQMYSELAEKFKPYSNVLGEMSERSGLQTNKDVLRLYERWVATGSNRLRNILNEQGIQIPMKSDLKIKH